MEITSRKIRNGNFLTTENRSKYWSVSAELVNEVCFSGKYLVSKKDVLEILGTVNRMDFG